MRHAERLSASQLAGATRACGHSCRRSGILATVYMDLAEWVGEWGKVLGALPVLLDA